MPPMAAKSICTPLATERRQLERTLLDWKAMMVGRLPLQPDTPRKTPGKN